MTNQPPDTATAIGRLYTYFSGHESSTGMRFLLIIGLAIGTHLLVKITRHISEWLIYKSSEKKNPIGFMTQKPKFITVTRLIVSGVIFIIYFFAVGLILQELFAVNLTAYLASASIIGLAISFGSQGLVQDIVTGLTLIFCDAMDVGDLVEIAGNAVVSGRVETIGLRFTVLVNFYHQRVMIPNRTIANVSRFPMGGLDAYADVQLPAGADPQKTTGLIGDIARGMREQFAALILNEPTLGRLELTAAAENILRVHFKIWPGQFSLLETTFRQRVVSAMKAFDPNYADWQVPVTYRSHEEPGKAKAAKA